MAKFVYLYTGGSMAETPEAQQQVMAAWGAWFGELGAAIIDGGNPFGAAASVGADGSVGAASVIAKTDISRSSGFPRMARRGHEVQFAWTEFGKPSRVRTAVTQISNSQ